MQFASLMGLSEMWCGNDREDAELRSGVLCKVKHTRTVSVLFSLKIWYSVRKLDKTSIEQDFVHVHIHTCLPTSVGFSVDGHLSASIPTYILFDIV